MRGKAWKFGDNISTDHIIPGRYYYLRSNMLELAKHVMEDANPEFAKKLEFGDFIVAGKNFGCGSSREHAPLAIKIAGVSAVLAKSFSRIFYRNAVNIGLPLLTLDTNSIDSGDELEVNLSNGTVKNVTKWTEMVTKPLPKIMIKILQNGGLVNFVKKHGELPNISFG
jgi:3-isopropylmalate/(R)-2-methylmalate dehydratase small subunit